MSLPSATTKLGGMLEDACKCEASQITAATPAQLMKRFMGAIADYIDKYITVSGTFVGTTITTPPSPFSCPVTKASFVTTGLKAGGPICASADLASWTLWLTGIYTMIGTVTITGTAVTTAISPMIVFPLIAPSWTRDDLKSAIENEQSVFDKIANNIITDMKKVNLTTYSSMVSGTATGMDTITYVYA